MKAESRSQESEVRSQKKRKFVKVASALSFWILTPGFWMTVSVPSSGYCFSSPLL
jgi:hypothetical protein